MYFTTFPIDFGCKHVSLSFSVFLATGCCSATLFLFYGMQFILMLHGQWVFHLFALALLCFFQTCCRVSCELLFNCEVIANVTFAASKLSRVHSPGHGTYMVQFILVFNYLLLNTSALVCHSQAEKSHIVGAWKSPYNLVQGGCTYLQSVHVMLRTTCTSDWEVISANTFTAWLSVPEYEIVGYSDSAYSCAEEKFKDHDIITWHHNL